MLLTDNAKKKAIELSNSTDWVDHSSPKLQAVEKSGASDYVPLEADLSLKFAKIDGVTRLVARDHHGPLLVQKPLYPEGYEVCHAVIIHPPGGIVSGDQLAIAVQAEPSAHAQMTTPGAAKWYRSNGRTAKQTINIEVKRNARVEWVPQETIFFNHAQVEIDHQVSLEDDATYVGCEILCFGRTASGEAFESGKIKQRTSIRRNSKLIWLEQISLQGNSTGMKGSLTLGGKTVCATLIMVGKTISPSVRDSLREEIENLVHDPDQVGVSQLKSVVVVRYLGNSSEVAKRIMLHAWGLCRPEMLGREAITPRMWST